jgi:hypothetical protein
MKDYKAECDRLRGELKQVTDRLARIEESQQREEEREFERKEEARKFFREFLLDVLGR